MKTISISEMRNNSVLRIYSQRHLIQTNPLYQRMGEIWTLEKRQLLIDSILNDFDIPKLYFHEFPEPKKIAAGKEINFAIIDGRQRLETIWAFINNEFTLSEDFVFYADKSVTAQSMTYREMAEKYPILKDIFDSFSLPIMCVRTDDLELIEEMFSRLNEAMPLNAAEKRNAFGGLMTVSIRRVAAHKFFKIKVAFANTRYQFREAACKFLFLTHMGKVMDTKKTYLDDFVKSFKKGGLEKQAKTIEAKVNKTLALLENVFIAKDALLKKPTMLTVYYLVFDKANSEGWIKQIKRKKLLDFERIRHQNSETAEKDMAKAQYELLEFDRLSSQGTNDGASIKFRVDVLANYIQNKPYQ